MKVYKISKAEKDEDYGFWHQCKQRKPKIILAKCSYNSAAYGHAIPSFINCKNIKAFNVEPYNTQSINYVIKTQLPDSRRRKDDISPKNENFEYHECNRTYCSFWLKFHYDLALSDCKKNWICPFCQGICHWSRCSRQDQLVKMKALLYSEGGNLDHLFDSRNKIHQIIAENWVRSEKWMYKTDEENFRPPSPIRPVRRNPQLYFACDSTVESNHDTGPIVTAQELKELMAKKDEIMKLSESIKKMKQDERDKAIDRLKIGNYYVFNTFSSKNNQKVLIMN